MADIREYKNGFKSIQLLNDQTIGIGSYGRVCKAKCDALICAAKILHPTLFDPTIQVSHRKEHRLPMRRFEQECHFLSSIRHPNIVQYLGTYQDPDTQLPVLLMELMDDSLTHFLDSSKQLAPYHVQVNICHDIILAISFLHSNKIIHRDLSSNNVLMIGNVRAKVTDFGMARFGDQSMTKVSYTVAPGTDVYMPPEAMQDKPEYTEKIDCFSFGVLIIQLLTQLFPNPGERRRALYLNHPKLKSQVVEVRISEIERRQSHINAISSDNMLRQIGIDCINDNADERPSALELCERIRVLKESSAYCDSSTERSKLELDRSLIEKDRELRNLREQIDNLHLEVLAGKQENEQLKQLIEQSAKEGEERQRQFELLHKQLKVNEQLMSKSSQEPESRWNTVPGAEQQINPNEIKWEWKQSGKAPRGMIASFNPAVDDDTVYIKPPDASYVLPPRDNVYAFDTTNSLWSQLPNCPTHDCPSVIIDNLLTLIGGNQGSRVTNKLFSLTGEGSRRRWCEIFLPMPTKRFGQTALNTGTVLIVAGGMGDERTRLKTVEVMNIETHQWSSAVDLLEPLFHSFSAVIGDRIYLQGGLGGDKTFTKVVFTCSVTSLLLSCSSKSLGTRVLSTLSRSNKTPVWNRIADIPVTDSTCVSLHGKLLVVGGEDSENKPTSAVHMYDSTTNSWEVISHMPTPRYWCYAAALSDTHLMVVGGMTDNGVTDTVEISQFLLKY